MGRCVTTFLDIMVRFEDVESRAESRQVCPGHVPEDHKHDIHGKLEGMSPVAGCYHQVS